MVALEKNWFTNPNISNLFSIWLGLFFFLLFVSLFLSHKDVCLVNTTSILPQLVRKKSQISLGLLEKKNNAIIDIISYLYKVKTFSMGFYANT